MVKIAIFQTDLGIGGIQKSLVNLLNTLDYTKYSVDLYLFDDANAFKKQINKKVKVLYLKKGKYINRFISFDILNKFYKNQVVKKYDIAIDYNSYSMDTALACINTKAEKHITWLHNDVKIKLDNEYKYKILYRFFKGKFKYFDKFVGVSDEVIVSFKKVYDKKIDSIVIPNIINDSEIDLKLDEETIDVDKKKVNIASTGRLVYQKGFDLLLDEFKSVVKKRNDIHLYIIGDGPLKERLESQINDNGLEEYVTITGYLNNPYALMNKMDAFTLMSRYEGQGMVIMEAYHLGLDIIIPKRLEKYVENIDSTKNIKKAFVEQTKKKNKRLKSIDFYNQKILSNLEELFKI